MNNHTTRTDTESTLLLSYTVTSDPSPLLPGQNGKVSIQLACSKTIYCDTIVIQSPQGVLDNDIFNSTATLCISNTCWTTGGYEYIHDDDTHLYYQQWTLTNASLYGVVSAAEFDITGTVNAAGGTAQLVIKEDSGHLADDLTEKKGTFPVTKGGKPAFYLQNLIAVDPLSIAYPCGAFQQGHPIEISWEGNGTSYKLYQSGISTAIYSGQATNYKLISGITSITTFFCVASDDKGNELFETLTLTVINPKLTVSTVTTYGNESVNGGLNVGGATTCNTLHLDNNSGIKTSPTAANADNIRNNAGQFNLSGDFSSDSAQMTNMEVNNITSQLSFSAADIKVPYTFSLQQPAFGTLNSGNITADSLTIKGDVDYTDRQFALFGAYTRLIKSKDDFLTHQSFATDGLAVLTINGFDPFLYGGLKVDDGAWIYATGGTTMDQLNITFNLTGFISLPVPAGATLYYQGQNMPGYDRSNICVYWFPLGNNTASYSEATAPAAGNKVDDNDPAPALSRYIAAKRQQQQELVASIETILDITFDTAIKAAMIDQLMAL